MTDDAGSSFSCGVTAKAFSALQSKKWGWGVYACVACFKIIWRLSDGHSLSESSVKKILMERPVVLVSQLPVAG